MGTREGFARFVKSGTERAAKEGGVESTAEPRLLEDLNFYRNVYKGFAEINWLRLLEDIDSHPNINT